jgi:hypothetical protein
LKVSEDLVLQIIFGPKQNMYVVWEKFLSRNFITCALDQIWEWLGQGGWDGWGTINFSLKTWMFDTTIVCNFEWNSLLHVSVCYPVVTKILLQRITPYKHKIPDCEKMNIVYSCRFFCSIPVTYKVLSFVRFCKCLFLLEYLYMQLIIWLAILLSIALKKENH